MDPLFLFTTSYYHSYSTQVDTNSPNKNFRANSRKGETKAQHYRNDLE